MAFASPRPLIEAYTLLPRRRLVALERAARRIVKGDVPGDVVECGTAQGGSAALMAVCLERLHSDKRVHVFDTFEGLPPPTAADPDYASAMEWVGKCRGDLDDVQKLFDALGVLPRAVFVKGTFDKTVPCGGPPRIALLHLDADWYDSTRVCLDHLWDRVSPGGIVQVDDYGTWKGCRRAVDEFFEQRGFNGPKRFIDDQAFWVVKTPACDANTGRPGG
jgi:hypothetical protein